METKDYTLELDYNDTEENIYMWLTRPEFEELVENMQNLLKMPDDGTTHEYRKTVIDDYEGKQLKLTVGLHKWG